MNKGWTICLANRCLFLTCCTTGARSSTAFWPWPRDHSQLTHSIYPCAMWADVMEPFWLYPSPTDFCPWDHGSHLNDHQLQNDVCDTWTFDAVWKGAHRICLLGISGFHNHSGLEEPSQKPTPLNDLQWHWGQGPKYPLGTWWKHWEHSQHVTPMCPVIKCWVHFKYRGVTLVLFAQSIRCSLQIFIPWHIVDPHFCIATERLTSQIYVEVGCSKPVSVGIASVGTFVLWYFMCSCQIWSLAFFPHSVLQQFKTLAQVTTVKFTTGGVGKRLSSSNHLPHQQLLHFLNLVAGIDRNIIRTVAGHKWGKKAKDQI